MKNFLQKDLDSFLSPTIMSIPAYSIKAFDGFLKLDQNESPYDWPKDLKLDILGQLEERSWNHYPSAYSFVLEKILANNTGVNEREVVLASGSSYLITILLNLLGRHCKGKVIIARPTFPLYESHCLYENIPYSSWLLDENYQYSLDLLPTVEEHSLICLTSPNNPTGTELKLEDLAKLLSKYPSSIFIADEAYFEFSNQNYADLLKDYSNLIVLRTFSKALSLASLRLGYAIGCESILNEVRKLVIPFMLNDFSTITAQTILTQKIYQEMIKEHLGLILKERDFLQTSLQRILDKNYLVIPSKANFVFIKALQGSSQDLYQHLISKKILVRDISKSKGCENALRITVGTEEQNQMLLDGLLDFKP